MKKLTRKQKRSFLSDRYIDMLYLYHKFAREYTKYSFTLRDALDCYKVETFGAKQSRKMNGFLLGKSWLGVTTKMWKEDIERGDLSSEELLQCCFNKDDEQYVEKELVKSAKIARYTEQELMRGDKYPLWWMQSFVENIRQGKHPAIEYGLVDFDWVKENKQ